MYAGAAELTNRETPSFGVKQSAFKSFPLTTKQNVLFPLSLVGIKGREAENVVKELLEYMEIAERADYLPAILSGGEQQRVSIARALANKPSLILADEPTASLDTTRGKMVMELLRKIAKENQSAVIVVTHDERMIAGFDHMYHLKRRLS